MSNQSVYIMKFIQLKSGFRWVSAVLCIAISPIISQGQSAPNRIRILNQDSNSEISGVVFKYSQQNGVSDSNGEISIRYEAGQSLFLSHISYGQWSLSDREVIEAIKNEAIYKDEVVVNLLPVTILAVRSKSNEIKSLTIGQHDGLLHDAGQFLSQLPEFSGIRKSANYGFDPVLRGFKYDQLNVVVDGAQSSYAACPNRMDPAVSQITLNMMDQVEILKGPYSLRYGNAFGGVINFTSLPFIFTEKSNINGRISGGYENNGNIYRSEGMLTLSEKVINLKLFGSFAQGDDYRDATGTTIPADFLRGSFGTKLGVKLGEKQIMIASVTRNFARDTEFPSLAMDLITDDTWLLNAQHELKLNGDRLKSWNTIVYASLVDHLMDNSLRIIVPRTMNVETPATTQTYGGRTEGLFKFGTRKLYLGADFKQSLAQGNRQREMLTGPMAGKIVIDKVWQDSRVSNGGLFSEFQLPMGKSTLFLSGRIDVNQAMANDLSTEFIKIYPKTNVSRINPGISAGLIHNFGKAWSGSLWLGRVQRSGSISERYINYLTIGLDPYEVVGNPQIEPEINNQIDLVLGYKILNTTLNLTLFGAYLQNYISAVINPALTPRLATSPGVRQITNIAEGIKTGFEFSWSQKLAAGLQHQLAIAYTYGQDLVIDEPLPEIAPLDFRYTLSGIYFKNRFRPEVQLRHVLKQNRISRVFGEQVSPNFTLVDVNMKYKISQVFYWSIGVNNLFNTAYYEHLNRSIPGTAKRPIYSSGQNFFSTLTVNF